MLKMSVENIRRIMKEGMNFEGNFPLWNYRFDSNCYAFVLGLDVNVNDICDNAYWPGNIAKHVIKTRINNYASTAERVERQVFNDFNALGITYEVHEDENKYQYLQEIDHPSEYWDILFFRNPCNRDYHFARVGSNGILYHKPGWQALPKIADVEDIENSGYQFIKRYRVKL